jgi:RNA polymerase I-specific transcription initiation factor RRN6
MHMNLDILEYGTSARYNSSSSLAHSYFERRLPFYQLSAMLSDLSVHQTVLLGHENVNDIEPIVWSKTVRSNHLLYTSKDIDELDDFIVPDGLDRSFTPGLKLESQTPRLLSLSAAQPAPRSMDYTQIYGALISNDQESVANKDSVSVDTVAMQLRKTILEDSGSFDLSPGYL